MIQAIWHFHSSNDTKDWLIPGELGGIITGGTLWIRGSSEKLADAEYLEIWNWKPYELCSPENLNIPARKAKKLRIRLLNLSPETDGRVCWTTRGQPGRDAGNAQFSMKPYSKTWQEIVCHLDEVPWNGTLDHFRLSLGLMGARGDIYIEWIAITDGTPRRKYPRPEINSPSLIPRIEIPGISQEDFQSAFDVLDECLVYDPLPVHGFNYPFTSPGASGAGYGHNWWLLDASIAAEAIKWINLPYCENLMRGFIGVQAQNPDGRIDHEGKVINRGAPGDLSSIPRYFETAFNIARLTKDASLRLQIYESMRRYLNWWLSPVKRDPGTGLITGYYEESFSLHKNHGPRTAAPVDLNVAVVLGSSLVAELAERLGYKEEAARYRKVTEELGDSINQYMWDEERGAYYSYQVVEGRIIPNLISYTFDPFRLHIASPERCEPLIRKLLDPALFNWGTIPLTALAKTDEAFTIHRGEYDPAAWSGDVWTMRNMPIIAGLGDIGRHDLAAELNWKTITIFNANYAEFLEPIQGRGEGIERFGWTAAQYIQAIIENLFGLDYDATKKRLRITPHLPAALRGKRISLKNLILPPENGRRLHLTLWQQKENGMLITLEVSGISGDHADTHTDDHTVEFFLYPWGEGLKEMKAINLANHTELPIIQAGKGGESLKGIRIRLQGKLQLEFSFR